MIMRTDKKEKHIKDDLPIFDKETCTPEIFTVENLKRELRRRRFCAFKWLPVSHFYFRHSRLRKMVFYAYDNDRFTLKEAEKALEAIRLAFFPWFQSRRRKAASLDMDDFGKIVNKKEKDMTKYEYTVKALRKTRRGITYPSRLYHFYKRWAWDLYREGEMTFDELEKALVNIRLQFATLSDYGFYKQLDKWDISAEREKIKKQEAALK